MVVAKVRKATKKEEKLLEKWHGYVKEYETAKKLETKYAVSGLSFLFFSIILLLFGLSNLDAPLSIVGVVALLAGVVLLAKNFH